MADYGFHSAPWYELEAKRLVLKEGIMAIGKYAFYSCSGFADILSHPIAARPQSAAGRPPFSHEIWEPTGYLI